ncbi:MAG: biotin/lipoyl-binding protein [Nitrospirae bacterium]|nr:biotin/lipoyl-binding protein [Nitrospirota bacterium]
MKYACIVEGRQHDLEVKRIGERKIEINLGGRTRVADVLRVRAGRLSLLIEGRHHTFTVTASEPDKVKVTRDGRAWDVEVRAGGIAAAHAARRGAQKGRIAVPSPMPGRVLKVLPKAGDAVRSGETIAIIEAMKMENEIKSPKDGRVVKVEAREGDTVDSGDVLLVVDDAKG